MSLIVEVNRFFLDEVIKRGLSPPLCIGRWEYDPAKDDRVSGAGKAAASTRWFVGFCTVEQMESYLRRCDYE